MLLKRDCSLVPARALFPSPAPLPSLRDALQRRAAVFGPVEADAAPAASRGPWQALGDVARRVVETLIPPQVLA